MSNTRRTLANFLPTLQNRDEFFEKLAREQHIGTHLLHLCLLLTALLFFYGAVMGSNTGMLQALTAGVKLPVLFFLSLLICFPAFYIVQFILGSTMKISQMAATILSGFVLTAAIMVSFTPIVIFFVLTGGNYHFMQLLHVAIFVVAGLFGMRAVLDALRFSCEQKGIYPKTGVVVFRFWVVILAFVGIQLAWNLRPFLAQKDEPYALFRSYEGNFYTAVIYSISKLTEPSPTPPAPPRGPVWLGPDSTAIGR
jgi:hypothetical protein